MILVYHILLNISGSRKAIADANKVAMYSHMLYLYAYTYLLLGLVQKEMP